MTKRTLFIAWSNSSHVHRMLGGLCIIVLGGLWLGAYEGRGIGPVHAHGTGEPLLTHEPVGPYILYAWLEPWPAATGTMHVTVSVNEPLSDNPQQTYPVLNADVILRAHPPDPEAVGVQTQATHENALNKLFYEGRLFLPTPGQWQLYLDIQADMGSATHTWMVDVGGPTQTAPMGFIPRLADWFRSLFRRG